MRYMSQEHTRDLPDNRSFEERVFARFDAIDAWRTAVDARFDRVDARLDRVDARLDRLDARLDRLELRLDSLDARVEALEVQAEKRAVETKPIWERALAEILEVKNGLAELTRKIDVLSRDIVTVRADQLRLDDRLDKLDAKPS